MANEVVTIDGANIDSVVDFEGKLPDPRLTDLVPMYRKDADSDIVLSGEMSVQELFDGFGADAERKIAQFDANASTRTSEFDSHASAKTSEMEDALDAHTDGKKTELNNHTATKKAELDSHASPKTSEMEDVLDAHTDGKKTELNNHTTTKKAELDSHTSSNKGELDDYEALKESELNSYTSSKKTELNNHTTTKKGELDSHEAAKEDELDTYTNGLKPSLQAYVTEAEGAAADSANSAASSEASANRSEGAAKKAEGLVNVSGAASTIIADNLTASRALISNSSGKVVVSPATSTELGYLGGVTGNIQTQLNGKLGSGANAVSASKLQTARTITLGGVITGSVAFDGSKNVTLTTSYPNAQRRLPAGTILWFAGKSTAKPAYCLICDGSAVSRTSYADLFAAIGTLYGAGDGSTTFNLPNLMDAGDDGDLGYFIRAAVNDDAVGTKQADAIRNITGSTTHSVYGEPSTTYSYGSLYISKDGQSKFSNEGWEAKLKLHFDANNGEPSTNPMSGHAAGEDIRPYNISLIPMISF